MSELINTLNAINTVFAQSGNIPIPQVNETLSVAEYLVLVDQLQTQALARVDESLSAAKLAAAVGLDVSNLLLQLNNYRGALVDLRLEIQQTLAGFDANITLQDAWNRLVGHEQELADQPTDPGDTGNNPSQPPDPS